MTRWILLTLTAALILSAWSLAQSATAASQPHLAAADAVSAGRYLVSYGSCNECHTPGYSQSKGNVPEADRLTGSAVGFEGPWGVTYPTNLRLLLANMTESGWVQFIKNVGPAVRPPMPWYNLQRLSESDQRAIYAYIHSLGPAGKAVPGDVPPGGTATTPVILFQPIPPTTAAQAAAQAKR